MLGLVLARRAGVNARSTAAATKWFVFDVKVFTSTHERAYDQWNGSKLGKLGACRRSWVWRGRTTENSPALAPFPVPALHHGFYRSRERRVCGTGHDPRASFLKPGVRLRGGNFL